MTKKQSPLATLDRLTQQGQKGRGEGWKWRNVPQRGGGKVGVVKCECVVSHIKQERERERERYERDVREMRER